MPYKNVFTGHCAEIDVRVLSRDLESYELHVSEGYSDGDSTVIMSRDELIAFGQSLIDFANEGHA